MSIRSLKDIQQVRKAVLLAGAIALALSACQQDVAGDRWTLSRVVVNGKPGLELVGGPAPGNNLQFRP